MILCKAPNRLVNWQQFSLTCICILFVFISLYFSVHCCSFQPPSYPIYRQEGYADGCKTPDIFSPDQWDTDLDDDGKKENNSYDLIPTFCYANGKNCLLHRYPMVRILNATSLQNLYQNQLSNEKNTMVMYRHVILFYIRGFWWGWGPSI